MDKIELIKAEIERRKNELEKDKCINIDAKVCRINELTYLKRFIDTLPEEKPSEDLEKEQMRGSSEKPNTHCDDLEDAAYKYSFDSRPSIYGQVDVIDAFKAGAEWQKEQDEKAWIEDRNGCFWDGVEEGKKVMKEQMMKEAVPCEIDWYDGPFPNITEEQLYSYIVKHEIAVGDKVKLIIVKEDEK